MENKFEVRLGDLNQQQCEEVRQWRNKLKGVLRTPFFLTDKMQTDFYNNVICNRNSNNRFWGVYVTELIDSLISSNTVTMRMDNEFVGMIGLINIEWENSLAEISMIINQRLHSKGIGSKAFDLLLEKGFSHLNLNNIYGEVYECNPAIKFWTKQLERYNVEDRNQVRLPSRKYFNGEYYDSIYFNFNREDWGAAR